MRIANFPPKIYKSVISYFRRYFNDYVMCFGFIHLYLSAMINYIPRCSSCFDDYEMYYVCQYQGVTVDLKLSKIPFIRFIL